jgi:hypothetical protein
MAAIGDIVLVNFHGIQCPGWDAGQTEHPAIINGVHGDPNLIDAIVFVRHTGGPVQKASIPHESVAVAPVQGYGQWLTWRVQPT